MGSCECCHEPERERTPHHRRSMREILPHEKQLKRHTFKRNNRHAVIWEHADKSDIPQVRIGHCFSQKQPPEQEMIDLDRTSLNIPRYPSLLQKADMYRTNGHDRRGSPMNESDYESSDYTTSPDTSREHESYDSGREHESYDTSRDRESYDHVMNDNDQVIIEVTPKTPSPIPTPPTEYEDPAEWADSKLPPSPSSVIIKIEPRTPSPVEVAPALEQAEEKEALKKEDNGKFLLL